MNQRSLFWPLTLIATGVIWLLVSMNVIPAANLWALTYIWPYVLIAARAWINFAKLPACAGMDRLGADCDWRGGGSHLCTSIGLGRRTEHGLWSRLWWRHARLGED